MIIVLITRGHLKSGGFMKVETTVNLAGAVRRRIECAARAGGIPASALIVRVMRLVMKEYAGLVRHHRCVEYQNRSRDEDWRCMHVSLEGRDHEYFLDMRKLFKRSVSLLVAFGVEKYLDGVLEKLLDDNYDEDADNYPFKSYAVVVKATKQSICWKIYWGIPDPPRELLA
jgi:hypothetical protein